MPARVGAPRSFPGELAGLDPALPQPSAWRRGAHTRWLGSDSPASSFPLLCPSLSWSTPVLSALRPNCLLSLDSVSVPPSLTVAFPSRQLPCQSGCAPFLLGAWMSEHFRLLRREGPGSRLPVTLSWMEGPWGRLPVGSSLGQRALLQSRLPRASPALWSFSRLAVLLVAFTPHSLTPSSPSHSSAGLPLSLGPGVMLASLTSAHK